MKTEIKSNQNIEKEYNGEKSKGIEISEEIFSFRKPASQEEMTKSVQSFFLSEIGRELSKEELTEYFKLYKSGKTNFWHYAKKIQDTNKV